MLKRLPITLAFIAVAAMAAAQFDIDHRPSPFAGRSLLTLALFDEVRTELKTTAELNSKIDGVLEKMNGERQDLFQNAGGDFDSLRPAMEKLNIKWDDEVVKLFTPDQVTRLKQLFIQYNGALALQDSGTQKDLALTDNQKAQVKKASDDFYAKMREQFSSGFDPDALAKLTDDLKTALDKVLTDDQRTKFKAMGGAKFEFKKVAAAGGGGGG